MTSAPFDDYADGDTRPSPVDPEEEYGVSLLLDIDGVTVGTVARLIKVPNVSRNYILENVVSAQKLEAAHTVTLTALKTVETTQRFVDGFGWVATAYETDYAQPLLRFHAETMYVSAAILPEHLNLHLYYQVLIRKLEDKN